jgi:hypothetical protein
MDFTHPLMERGRQVRRMRIAMAARVFRIAAQIGEEKGPA